MPTTTTTTVPRVIPLWFFISTLFVFWDAGYLLLRPSTLPGGPLHSPIWTPYSIYARVDSTYGWQAYNRNDGFPGAQAIMNLFESALNILWLWRWWGGETDLLLGTVAPALTFAKTVLYSLVEVCGGFAGLNGEVWEKMVFYVLPTGTWIVVPAFITAWFWERVREGLEDRRVKSE